MKLNRRGVLMLYATAMAAPAVIGRAIAQDNGRVQAAVARFAGLPATASCLIVAEHPTAPWQAATTLKPDYLSAALSRPSS